MTVAPGREILEGGLSYVLNSDWSNRLGSEEDSRVK